MLGYLALRLLDVGPQEPPAAEARRWILAQPGGVRAVPQWGRFWLALLGLVPYREVAPIPPEAMLLPRWVPCHPERLIGWTHTLYKPMAYLYGARFRVELGPLAAELRAELFPAGHPARVLGPCPDALVPRGGGLRALQLALRVWESVHSHWLRRAALARCHRAVAEEQQASQHHGLSSVNALVECLALYAHDRRHPLLDPAVARLDYWRWSDELGIRIAGDRSRTWDTSFAAQALLAAGAEPAAGDPVTQAVRRARTALAAHRITEWRGPRRPRRTVVGGWAFSDGHSSWPVGDTTAEAINALLDEPEQRPWSSGLDAPAGRPGERPSSSGGLGPDALHAALDVILDRQNPDGGFGTLDRRRVGHWMEALNPTEMFAGCMTDSSSVDCTGSALTALARLRPHLDPVARRRVDHATARGVAFVRASQNPDGSFAGTWGINHTYAAFLAARGLRAAGLAPGDPSLRALGLWLTHTQLADGGWGEDWRGCIRQQYLALDHGLPEMTSWAVLAGLDTLGAHHPTVERGIHWLLDHQLSDGSWPGEHVNGVFFRTMMLTYHLYPAYFPTWALGRYLGAVA
jgi:lanosterol synthase